MTLSNEDKLSIINQKIRSAEYSKYSSELDLRLEQSVQEPDQEVIADLNLQISNANAKLSILTEEKTTLEG